MGNSPSISLRLANQSLKKPFFRAGDAVFCQMELKNPSAGQRIGVIECWLRAKEQLSWTETRTYYYYNAATKTMMPATETIRKYRSTERFRSPSYFLLPEGNYLTPQSSNNGNATLESQAHYQSPDLEFNLPQHVPPSYKYDEYNFVTYQVKAKMPIPGWLWTSYIDRTLSLTVRQSGEKRDQLVSHSHPMNQSATNQLSWVTGGQFTANLYLPESVLRGGETYQLKLLIKNPERISYSKISLGLKQHHHDERRSDAHLMTSAEFDYEHLKEENQVDSVIVTEGRSRASEYQQDEQSNNSWGASLKNLVSRRDHTRPDYEEITVPFLIPNNLQAAFQGTYFRISYELVCEITLPMPHSNFNLTVPVEIIAQE